MTQTKPKEFGKWRSYLWPVHGYEIKKLLPMLMMFFLILFNYTILRDTKDTLIVTKCGAETIPFLKVWGTVPLAIVLMLIYSKLSNILSKKALFYTSVVPFLIFFGLFALVVYPLREVLEPTASANWLEAHLHSNFHSLISMYRSWTYSIFYVMAELWGSFVLSLLFWGFANDITRISEAKRFYSLFGLGGNFALLCSGPAIHYFSKRYQHLPEGQAWGCSLYWLMGMVVVAGLALMAVYAWTNRYVLTDPRFYSAEEIQTKKKDKPKMSLKESFAYLAKSKYILCLAMIVLCYGICINLVEVTWKSQLRLQYPNPTDYSAFMGMFSGATGLITIFMMLFIGGNVIRRFGWGVGALFTPVVLAITGFGFFAFTFLRSGLEGATMAGLDVLLLAVMIGAAQNIFSKSAKYSLFDPTKEMAYIPLDQEQKVKGKAAIDVVGARLGKSGGSLIQMVLIITVGSLAAALPYVAGILAVVLGGWMVAAKALSGRFNALQAEKEAEALATAQPTEQPVSTGAPAEQPITS